mmetsp:Transcript_44934/g.109108  ORF Transcript_44934/g.109108 Transcript_44934/m.109108 type:complete len:160 (+) Transcript_44934:1193-1672(+)
MCTVVMSSLNSDTFPGGDRQKATELDCREAESRDARFSSWGGVSYLKDTEKKSKRWQMHYVVVIFRSLINCFMLSAKEDVDVSLTYLLNRMHKNAGATIEEGAFPEVRKHVEDCIKKRVQEHTTFYMDPSQFQTRTLQCHPVTSMKRLRTAKAERPKVS